MDYLARSAARRSDPREVLPGTRTVMAVALDYQSPELSERSSRSAAEAARRAAEGQGEIARYARGTDYHRVMEERLAALTRSLANRHPSHRFRYYVDTGPVLERSWAEAAGLGWIGKNACAIDARRGSYFFIGVVLMTLVLPPDPPSTDHCGTCRLCLDACPTGAIVEPYRIDSRLCISYLTIEHRGSIPQELREPMGGLVFGCDICQEVCPFNRPERPAGDPALAARPENLNPPLYELALLTREGFAARFRRSAVKRAKWAGLLRNVVIALGNGGRGESLEVLHQLSAREDVRSDPALEECIAWARARLRA